MTTENILALLAGRDSKNPMGFDELLAASGMDSAMLISELEHICHQIPAPINCAQITRAGKSQMVYWPTGIVEKAEWQHITINPRKLPPSGSLARPPRTQHAKPTEPIANRMAEQAIQKVEETMQKQTESRQPVTLKHVLELVIGRPGIKREEILQCLVYSDGSNNQQVRKIIVNATQNGRISVDDEDRLHPGPMISASLQRRQPKPPKPEKTQKPVGKVVPYKESGQPLPPFTEQNAGPTQNAEAPSQPAAQEPAQNCAEKSAEPPVSESSNVHEFKRRDAANTDKPVSDTDKSEPDRYYTAHQVFVDATGQLIIQQPGMVRMVFPAPDTRRIQKLLLAIDLESLCV